VPIRANDNPAKTKTRCSSGDNLIDGRTAQWYKVLIARKGEAVSALRGVGGAVAVLMLVTPMTVFVESDRGAPAAQVKPATGQESRSAPFATELAQMLDAKKINSIATKDVDHYVGALYVPGIQLLVVRAKYAATDRMNYLLLMKEYRDAYVDLNSASDRGSRVLISDLGANGLHFRREKDQPFDVVDIAGKSLSFDGKWGGKDNPSREEYTKTFETTDEQYSHMLQMLIEVLKKSS
jgi:hypothetical protein